MCKQCGCPCPEVGDSEICAPNCNCGCWNKDPPSDQNATLQQHLDNGKITEVAKTALSARPFELAIIIAGMILLIFLGKTGFSSTMNPSDLKVIRITSVVILLSFIAKHVF